MVPLRAIASRYGLGESSVQRHIANGHTEAALPRTRRVSAEVAPSELLLKLAEVLDDLDAVRQHALARGNAGLLLRSARETAAVVKLMASDLRLDSTELGRDLKTAEDLARAVAVVARREPSLGYAVAVQLRTAGHTEAADELERQADSAKVTTTTTDLNRDGDARAR